MTSPTSSHSVNWSIPAANNVIECGETRGQGLWPRGTDVRIPRPNSSRHRSRCLLAATLSRKFRADFSPMRSRPATSGSFEPVEVRHVAHKATLDQLANEDFAAAFNVHRAARAPMFDTPADLGRAIRVQAAPDNTFVVLDDAGCARDFGATLRASRGKPKGRFLARPLGHHHIHDGGNDFASFFYLDRVPNADVLLADVVFVVKRGAADGAPSQEDRFRVRRRV